jgi:hypothetical protein
VRTKLSEILKIFFAIVVVLAITTSLSAQEPDAPPEQPDSGPEEGKSLSKDLDCLCEELKKLKELLEAEKDKEEK